MSTLVVRLSPHGIDIARFEGGYLGYQADIAHKQAQQQQQQIEQGRLEREAAEATIIGPKLNKWAIWISLAGIAVSGVFSYISMQQSSELDDIKQELKSLRNQTTKIDSLTAQVQRLQMHPSVKQLVSPTGNPSTKATTPDTTAADKSRPPASTK